MLEEFKPRRVWYVEHRKSVPHVLIMEDGVAWVWSYHSILTAQERW